MPGDRLVDVVIQFPEGLMCEREPQSDPWENNPETDIR